jgi:hypothetical protein
MNISEPRPLLLVAVLLSVPPLGPLLKSSMTLHMLVQISAFVLLGALLGRGWLRRMPAASVWARTYRWPLLLTATATLMAWMIPRLLDLAVQSAAIDAAKAASLVLLAGLPLALAWAGLGPVLRGILHVEALATVLRLGWLYLESPVRLCAQYGLNDQAQLGRALLMAGALYAAWLALRALGLQLPVWRPCG